MPKAFKSGPDNADERLRTRRYSRNFDVVYQQLLLMARRPIKGWWLEDREMAQGIVRVKYKRLMWQARVTAWVKKLEGGGCEVDVESAAATAGWGGNHKRRVRGLLRELDDALLGENPFHPDFR